jgi:hypothetical protein
LRDFFDILPLAGGDKPRLYKRDFTEQVGVWTGGISPPENWPASTMIAAGKSLGLS